MEARGMGLEELNYDEARFLEDMLEQHACNTTQHAPAALHADAVPWQEWPQQPEQTEEPKLLPEEQCRECNDAAMRCLDGGQLAKAFQLLQRAVSHAQSIAPSSHPQNSTLTHTSALHPPAPTSSSLSPSQHWLAVTYNNLACYYQRQAKPQAALHYLTLAAGLEGCSHAAVPGATTGDSSGRPSPAPELSQDSNSTSATDQQQQQQQSIGAAQPTDGSPAPSEASADAKASTLLNMSTVLSGMGRYEAALGHVQDSLMLLTLAMSATGEEAGDSGRQGGAGASGAAAWIGVPSTALESDAGSSCASSGGVLDPKTLEVVAARRTAPLPAAGRPRPSRSNSSVGAGGAGDDAWVWRLLEAQPLPRLSLVSMCLYNRGVVLEHLQKLGPALRAYQAAAHVASAMLGQRSPLAMTFGKTLQAFRQRLQAERHSAAKSRRASAGAASDASFSQRCQSLGQGPLPRTGAGMRLSDSDGQPRAPLKGPRFGRVNSAGNATLSGAVHGSAASTQEGRAAPESAGRQGLRARLSSTGSAGAGAGGRGQQAAGPYAPERAVRSAGACAPLNASPPGVPGVQAGGTGDLSSHPRPSPYLSSPPPPPPLALAASASHRQHAPGGGGNIGSPAGPLGMPPRPLPVASPTVLRPGEGTRSARSLSLPEGAAVAASGDALRGDAIRGDSVRGDPLRGDSVRSDATRGDAIRGDTVRGDALRSSGNGAEPPVSSQVSAAALPPAKPRLKQATTGNSAAAAPVAAVGPSTAAGATALAVVTAPQGRQRQEGTPSGTHKQLSMQLPDVPLLPPGARKVEEWLRRHGQSPLFTEAASSERATHGDGFEPSFELPSFLVPRAGGSSSAVEASGYP